jgi:glycerophosphoryl diester phosphodiesterase
MASSGPLVLGHLGNTLEAFARCRAAGVDGVELDVRRAGDGSLAVHHDATIEGIGPISDLTSAGLPDHVPTLGQALRECAGLTVNIEIKNLPVDPDYDPTEEIVRLVLAAIGADGEPGRMIVSSFSLATIDAVRVSAPAVRTAFLTLPAWDQTRALSAAADRGHNAIHPHRRSLDADLVRAVHNAGMTIHPWALDDVASALAAADLGVDMIITDDPDAVVPAIAVRSGGQRS